METIQNYKVNYPFAMILFLIFLILKLTKVIDWSWWWVTAPLWGIFALIIAALILLVLYKIIIILILKK